MNASPARPIYYNVDRVRDGRTYVTRAVRAVQKGKTIFIMVCSYQRPEPWQPSYRSPMPPNVPSPEECKDDTAFYRERAAAADSEYMRNIWTTGAEVFPSLRVWLPANASNAVSRQKPDSYSVCGRPLRRRCAHLLRVDEGKIRPRMRPRLSEGLNRLLVLALVCLLKSFTSAFSDISRTPCCRSRFLKERIILDPPLCTASELVPRYSG